MRRSQLFTFLVLFFLLLGFLTWAGARSGLVKSAIKSRNTFTILAVGDVMLGRSVNANIQMRQDPFWPYVNVAAQLNSADLTIGNLENPLISGCPTKRDGMIFCGAKNNAQGLARAGFDYLSLANNHTLNYGSSGFLETQQVLSENGIGFYGAGIPAFTEINGTKVGLIGYDDVSHTLSTEQISQEISQVAVKSDLTIVHFHWGQEYQGVSNTRQKLLAHAAIDAGADLVLGAHPHVVQESEYYQGVPIYYSLGNFIFDQEWSKETKKGLAVRFTYQGSNLQKVQELPVALQNYGQAFWE